MEQHKNQHDTHKDDLRHLPFDLKEHESYMKAIEMFLEAIQQHTGLRFNKLFEPYEGSFENSVRLPLLAKTSNPGYHRGEISGQWQVSGWSAEFKSGRGRTHHLVVERDDRSAKGTSTTNYVIDVEWETGKDGKMTQGRIRIHKGMRPQGQEYESSFYTLCDMNGEQYVGFEGQDSVGFSLPQRKGIGKLIHQFRGDGKRKSVGDGDYSKKDVEKSVGAMLQSAIDYIPGKGQYELTPEGRESL